MHFQAYYLTCLSHASYFLGAPSTGKAVVIDPQRDIDQYLAEAKRHGLTISTVFLTHFHADYVSGHIELQERTGAEIILGARAKAEYQFTAAQDQQVFDFGDFQVKVLETPGHTPESVCLLTTITEKSADKPWAVFTGDTLFVGDVGRPDLLSSVGYKAEDLASMLYHSLRDKLLTLPDETIVYPGHGAGSMCGKNLGTERSTTIGIQRAVNVALHDMSEPEFLELVAGQSQAPGYFAYDAELNRKQRQSLNTFVTQVSTLSLAELQNKVNDQILILDSRPSPDFQKCHLRGSMNIPLSGKFATWVGTMIEPTRRFIVLCHNQDKEETLTRLGRIGFDQCEGVFATDFTEHMSDFEKLENTEIKTINATAVTNLEATLTENRPQFLDVRTPREFNADSIPGSENRPLKSLESSIADLDPAAPILVSCRSGYRSAIACSILSKAGFVSIYDLQGGYLAWQAHQAKDPA